MIVKTLAQNFHKDTSLSRRGIAQLESGRTQSGVAEVFKVSQNIVTRLWNCLLELGNIRRRQSQGRPQQNCSVLRNKLTVKRKIRLVWNKNVIKLVVIFYED